MAFHHKQNKIPASFHARPDLLLAFLCTPSLTTSPFVQSTPKTSAIFSPLAHLRAFCCFVAWDIPTPGLCITGSLSFFFFFLAGSNVTFPDRSLLFILVNSAPFLATLIAVLYYTLEFSLSEIILFLFSLSS